MFVDMMPISDIEYNYLNIYYYESFTFREIEINLFIRKDRFFELDYKENSKKCKTIRVKDDVVRKIIYTFLNQNYWKISNDIHGFEGSILEIDMGRLVPQIQTKIWAINNETEERGLQEIYDVVLKIFDLCNINDTIIQKG